MKFFTTLSCLGLCCALAGTICLTQACHPQVPLPGTAGAATAGAGGGLQESEYTVPQYRATCNVTGTIADCNAGSGGVGGSALPACARWAGCETDSSGGSPTNVCTYSSKAECVAGQMIACSRPGIFQGIMVCDATPNVCKFNPLSGAGSCRECGVKLNEPCCLGTAACNLGTCQSDPSKPENFYTGTCK